MADVVKSLLGLILRLGLLLAGLVFFASVLVVGLLLLAVWLLRTLWGKVTGQPTMPWMFQFKRRPPWQRPEHNGEAATSNADVVDVEVKRIDTRR